MAQHRRLGHVLEALRGRRDVRRGGVVASCGVVYSTDGPYPEFVSAPRFSVPEQRDELLEFVRREGYAVVRPPPASAPTTHTRQVSPALLPWKKVQAMKMRRRSLGYTGRYRKF